MIQYINKIPTKIEYFEMLRTICEYSEIDVSEISQELDGALTAVCAYNGERMIGMGLVKKEQKYLCIEDLIVNSEPLKEEIQNNIIVRLMKQVNQMKYYDVTVRDCLDMQEEQSDSMEENDENANQNVGA